MTTLKQYAYGLALLASLALLIWGQQQRIEAADARAAHSAEQASASQQTATAAKALVGSLKNQLDTQRLAQVELRTQQNALRADLAARALQIEELKRENKELRHWADQPLPDAARRLRQRPAITGAAAYRAWLSGSGALHVGANRPNP